MKVPLIYTLRDTLNSVTLSRHLTAQGAVTAMRRHLESLKEKHGQAARLPYAIERSDGQDISQEIESLSK